MLQTQERPRDKAHTVTTTVVPPQDRQPDIDVERDDGLLATAGPIMMLCYGIAFATAVLTFMGSGEALMAVSISIGFAVMFFTIPLVMMSVRARHDIRWRRAQWHSGDQQVDTFTGPIDRASAVSHMVIVPVAVAIAFISFAVIWVTLRP